MASSGNLISYSNFSKTYTSDLLFDNTQTATGSNTSVYSVYVSSPSWYAQIRVNKDYREIVKLQVYASYWNGSTWVDAWSRVELLSNPFGALKEYNYQYYHNSTLGSTTNDVADAVLWEFYLVYSAPKNRVRLWMNTGSIGCMPEDTYNNLYKGRPIYSCGGPVSSSIYSLAGGKSRDTALSTFSQSAARGTLITASNERKLVAYKYN